METTEIYIKYLDNQPVPIDTAYGRGPQGALPLLTVAHLIAAFQALPNSPLALTFAGDITLHAIDNVAETSYNSWDSLAVLGVHGKAGTDPLIIKSKNDMEVDKSPTASTSSRASINKEVIQSDGIDINTEHLERPELIQKLALFGSQHRFVRLTSPGASGKSSLLAMYRHSLRKQADVIWISCAEDQTCWDLLRDKAGIDLANQMIVGREAGKPMVVFLDDAQNTFADSKFWTVLIKASANWMGSNIRFVISSTHLLAGGIESPTELQSLPRVERDDFLLSPQESEQFLDCDVIGLPRSMRFATLKTLLINECGGLIGALRQSVDSLKGRFSKDSSPSELALLQHFLSNDYVANMTRCFGSAHSGPIGDDFKQFLKRIFVNEKILPQLPINPKDQTSYSSLKKAGILVELPNATFVFSSHLAKRYYFNWMFPNRTLSQPGSLSQLVRIAVASMSSSVLMQSTVDGDFPKEAVFQH
eukprot:jgi/Hompol1/2713/HPOL_006138-RA